MKTTYLPQILIVAYVLLIADAFQIFNSGPPIIDVNQQFDKRAMTAYTFKAPFYLGNYFVTSPLTSSS